MLWKAGRGGEGGKRAKELGEQSGGGQRGGRGRSQTVGASMGTKRICGGVLLVEKVDMLSSGMPSSYGANIAETTPVSSNANDLPHSRNGLREIPCIASFGDGCTAAVSFRRGLGPRQIVRVPLWYQVAAADEPKGRPGWWQPRLPRHERPRARPLRWPTRLLALYDR